MLEFNEGYEIIAAETYNAPRAGRQDRIVLGRLETKLGTMFVTWASVIQPLTNRIDYFWGHYFSEEDQARADYHRRLLKKYEDKATQDE